MLKYFNSVSFRTIMFVALSVRLIAVFFSPGYGMHDDHFLIIEASSSWVDGYDYNNWLPWSPGNSGLPEGHSFTYVGLNYLYFVIMKWLGVADPQILMVINRLIHALFSLVVVWCGMKITEKLSNREIAVKVGWLLALLWIIPFVSVRNLVEVAAIPFLIYGTWLMIKNQSNKSFLLAGLLIGMAVSFRYQIGVFAIGAAAYYFFRKSYTLFIYFSIGVCITFLLTQGLVDYFIWGYPFAELISYITYNMNEGTGYLPNQNYFMYFMVLTGSLFIPLGLMLLLGFFKTWKTQAVIFIPTLIFILFHTLYPNRQERFILTILPYFIILGVIGFHQMKNINTKKWWSVAMIIFWIFNLPFLGFAVTMYSKKSRVEAMYQLYGNEIENDRILLEGSSSNRVSMMPKFYAKSWHCIFTERTDSTIKLNPDINYDYIFFFDEKELSERISNYKTIYPEMELVKKCEPSLIDRMLRELNPRNANEYIEVWKTNSKN